MTFVWSMINGGLYYGPPGATDYQLGPQTGMSALVSDYSSGTFGYSDPEYTQKPETIAAMGFTLKTSPDASAGAVYSRNFGWADFYILTTRNTENQDMVRRIAEHLISPSAPIYGFTLRQNVGSAAATADCVVEFLQHKGETFVLFNGAAGHLELYNLKREKVIDHFCGEDTLFRRTVLSKSGQDLLAEVCTRDEKDSAVVYFEVEQLFADPKYVGTVVEKGISFVDWVDPETGTYKLSNGRVYAKDGCVSTSSASA